MLKLMPRTSKTGCFNLPDQDKVSEKGKGELFLSTHWWHVHLSDDIGVDVFDEDGILWSNKGNQEDTFPDLPYPF